MPKETSIGVSNETKKLLKDFQEDVNAKSLDEAVRLSVGWAKSYNSNLLVSQVELADRVKKLEASQNGIFVYLSQTLQDILALKKEINQIKEEKQNVEQ